MFLDKTYILEMQVVQMSTLFYNELVLKSTWILGQKTS